MTTLDTTLQQIHRHAHTARRHRMYALVYARMGKPEMAAIARRLAKSQQDKRDEATRELAALLENAA